MTGLLYFLYLSLLTLPDGKHEPMMLMLLHHWQHSIVVLRLYIVFYSYVINKLITLRSVTNNAHYMILVLSGD